MALCMLAPIFFWLSPLGRSRREGRADVTLCIAELEIWHPSGKQPQEEWEHGVGAAGPQEGTAQEGGEPWKPV